MKLNPSKPVLTAARPAQRGIALVITLIMLSVTLIMAVAFLAVANRERVTVTLTSDGVNARLATDSALAAAQAQIIANVLGSASGIYNAPLIVSTNYIDYDGFTKNFSDPANVNYEYYSNAPGPLSGSDFEQVVANLLYLPRAPVLVSTNEPEGRYYLDLNRNGVFDATGTNLTFIDETGVSNGITSQIGDPQWIGVLQRADALHSPENQFIARYAFIALPVGNGLDLDHIHNQTKTEAVDSSFLNISGIDGYFRNQGVGSWEINLAAFLTDLNTNWWDPSVNPYDYDQWEGGNNRGAGFEDALSLLSWRYGYNYFSLATANMIFGSPNANAFRIDNIDEYSDGPLQTTTTNIDESVIGNPDDPTLSWAGADNTNRFFNLPAELFDATKSSSNFVARLVNAGSTNFSGFYPTYDRYTFYRMLQQLGTDSSADDDGKLNLNYDNTDGHGNVVRGAQTNLVPWTALAFFTAAADRMLRTYTTNWFQSDPTNYLATYYGWFNYPFPIEPTTGLGFTNNNPLNGCPLGTNFIPAFGITNIPVLASNQFVYSPAVNRILQLAANIYDASTNSFYPSVFRPQFFRDSFSGNIYIIGFETVTNVSGTSDPQLTALKDLRALPFGITSSAFNDMANVYGIPWILGAKKNLPNFNQFYMQNAVQLTRKVQVTRTKIEAWNTGTGGSQDFATNQMFIMSITNHVGYSLWNSYNTNYPGSPVIFVNDTLLMVLSNALVTQTIATNFSVTLGPFTWPGSAWNITNAPNARTPAQNSFIYGGWDFAFLPAGVYQFQTGLFIPLTLNPPFDTNTLTNPNFPQFQLMTTNWLQAYVLDNGHVVDYVQLSGPDGVRSVNNELLDYTNRPNPIPYLMWLTNASGTTLSGPNQGLVNQIYVSRTDIGAQYPNSWKAPPNMPPGLVATPTNESQFFNAFFTDSGFMVGTVTYNNTNLQQQAPYTPSRTMYDLTLWQPNDPLVHYLASDLTDTNAYTGIRRSDDPANNPVTTVVQNGLGQNVNIIGDDRYQPWGRISQFSGFNNVDKNPYNLAYRDSLVYDSDYWDFPTNRYPSVGWLGRVHRGTPWQTVYLKATNILNYANSTIPAFGSTTWMEWLGDASGFDATNSAPAQDDVLFDIFTTALDDNASHGTLSVNQIHLAAWSAVLSGISVISNTTVQPTFFVTPVQTNIIINPGGIDTNSPVWRMVEGPNGINAVRAGLFANGAFVRPGDIVRVPALAEQSPFINTNNAITSNDRIDYDVSDEMYERIPQQILGLVRVGSPRYVIYCYGQALRPAQDGTALDLSHNGLVTNYQVVAESAARAVISVHPQVTITVSPQTGNFVPVTNYTTTVENYTQLPPN